jgi:hypothetical protein
MDQGRKDEPPEFNSLIKKPYSMLGWVPRHSTLSVTTSAKQHTLQGTQLWHKSTNNTQHNCSQHNITHCNALSCDTKAQTTPSITTISRTKRTLQSTQMWHKSTNNTQYNNTLRVSLWWFLQCLIAMSRVSMPSVIIPSVVAPLGWLLVMLFRLGSTLRSSVTPNTF